MPPEHKYSLPPGLCLRRSRLVRLLGHGGFGLTYLADDTNLNRKVAIKELLPIDFAIREADGTTVVARTQQDKTNLEWARQRFVEEGRTLAALQHPSILHVYDIFELHGTAYLVTAFIEGATFEDWLRKDRPLRQEDLLLLTHSLLDALQLVHAQGFLHRDIKPENILMEEKTSRPVLIDFGNARMATGQKTENMTAVLTRGYAPLEQYQTKGRQGPFTDLYALGAVLYRAVKGAPPEDALDRMDADKTQALGQQQIPGYPPAFLATIDKALKMRREDRWQSCEEWKAALGLLDQPRRRVPDPVPWPSKVAWTVAALALLTVVGVAIGLWINHLPATSDSSNTGDATPPPSSIPAVAAIDRPTPAPLVAIAPSTPIARPSPPPIASPAPKPPPIATPQPATPKPPVSAPLVSSSPETESAAPASATKETPFVNSLGMRFVPVEITKGPTNGKRILFSVWDTRVQDYAEYARQKGITPEKPFFGQGPTHPVVRVSWDDATSFCQWLTATERVSGKIGGQDQYRLPSDHEWSCAVGIGRQENPKQTPEAKHADIKTYPWGTQWPPPKGVGNYHGDLHVDDFYFTSPAGSFAANENGLYDMGGNVWQWCQDWYNARHDGRVLRGASYVYSDRIWLRSSFRHDYGPTARTDELGFRCVLAVSGG